MTSELLPLSQLSLAAVLEAMAAPDPVPGGGAAAALAGALAAGLVAMVAGVTIGKPGYTAVGEEMAWVRAEARALQTRLTHLAEEDAVAYRAIRSAHRMPRQTAEERAARTAAIHAAQRSAAGPPLATTTACAGVLALTAVAAERGNHNAASDARVAALLADAALRGARHTALVNLHGLEDEEFVAAAKAQLQAALEAGEAAHARVTAAAGIPSPAPQPGSPAGRHKPAQGD